MVPSESAEAVPSKATTSGALPESGVAVKDDGGRLVGGATTISTDDVAVAPLSSVTVRTTL